jgi:hypothetical protein
MVVSGPLFDCLKEGLSMKIVTRIVLAYLICAPSIPSTQASDDRVEPILSKMSLEDKIDYIRGTGQAHPGRLQDIGRRVVRADRAYGQNQIDKNRYRKTLA